MINNIFKLIVLIVLIIFLVEKFYLLDYCDRLSGKSVKYSLGEIQLMNKCVSHNFCKIGTTSSNKLGRIVVKTWKCETMISNLYSK